MGTRWIRYEYGNPISEDNVRRCIELLRATAVAHREYDFPDAELEEKVAPVYCKINCKSNRRNWMKVSCRTNDDNPNNQYIDAVILYHLVKHRGFQWSLSVGFDQPVLPHVGDDNAKATYTAFAKELSEVIRRDLTEFGARGFCTIDHLGPNPDGTYPDDKQQNSKIGKLHYIAERDLDIDRIWVKSQAKKYKPEAPGWTRPGEDEACLREYTLK